MEKSFWAETINTATYILNRTGPSPQKLKTLYELWHKKTANIQHFKVFGCNVSVHIPKETRQDIKGYRIYIPYKRKIEVHRDVVFIPEKTNHNDTVHVKEKNQTILEGHIEESEENEELNEHDENSDTDSEDSVHQDDDNEDSEINDDVVNPRYN